MEGAACVVTGATSVIGWATALRMSWAEGKAKVIALCRDSGDARASQRRHRERGLHRGARRSEGRGCLRLDEGRLDRLLGEPALRARGVRRTSQRRVAWGRAKIGRAHV